MSPQVSIETEHGASGRKAGGWLAYGRRDPHAVALMCHVPRSLLIPCKLYRVVAAEEMARLLGPAHLKDKSGLEVAASRIAKKPHPAICKPQSAAFVPSRQLMTSV